MSVGIVILVLDEFLELFYFVLQFGYVPVDLVNTRCDSGKVY